MTKAGWRRLWPVALRMALAGLGIMAADRPGARGDGVRHVRRVLYDFDGDSCMWTKAGIRGPADISVGDLKQLIAEVAYDGSHVDSVLVNINAQATYYPTKIGTMRGSAASASERSQWPVWEQQRFRNMQRFYQEGIDPYAIMIAETKRRSREALLSYRMNDEHDYDFLKTQFWTDHPAWRLGGRALDFSFEGVRDYTLRLIEEAVLRYDCDGLELDFNRAPRYFPEGSLPSAIAEMDSMVRQIRTFLDKTGKARGRRLVLGVRVPSNYGRAPPTPSSVRGRGCDVGKWVKNGWVDFVVVSEYIANSPDLPIRLWKNTIDAVPIYAGIEPIDGVSTHGGGSAPARRTPHNSAEGDPPRGMNNHLTVEGYRRTAWNLIGQGADGIYLFNFFTVRELGANSTEPPFEVLKDL